MTGEFFPGQRTKMTAGRDIPFKMEANRQLI